MSTPVTATARQRSLSASECERPAARGQPLTRKDGQRRVPVSNESINKTLVLLANILGAAVERGGLETNPARGKRRRLKAPRPVRRVLEWAPNATSTPEDDLKLPHHTRKAPDF